MYAKSGFTYFVTEIFKKMSALNNLSKKGILILLGEDELLAKRVRRVHF